MTGRDDHEQVLAEVAVPGRSRRRLLTAAGALAGLAAIGTAGSVFLADRGSAEDRPTSKPPATVPVTRVTLSQTQTFDGTVGFGPPISLGSRQPGIVTYLPPVGKLLERGAAAFRVDEQPMIILYGVLPAYRPLTVGSTGLDVRQLEENLRALGHTRSRADDRFTADTGSAVKRLQKAFGLPQTGALEPGRIVFTPGPLRVAEHKVRVGDEVAAAVLTVTGTEHVVAADLDAKYQSLAKQGAAVTVRLPGGTSTPGVLTEVGSVGTVGEAGGTPKIKLSVTVADQRAFADYQQGPVQVTLLAKEKKDVLAVPIAALLALTAGGYGVEVVDASGGRVVPVQIGMFAAGKVEISGTGIGEGVTVAVPA